MNNNFMGFFDPLHGSLNMGQEFGRGPPGQQSGFSNMPLNMNHGGIGMPNYQHQRYMPYEANQLMGPLSPGVPGLTPGSSIGPPPSSRMMDMSLGRLQHYRAQQSQLQHSPVSLSPMSGMNAMSPVMTNQNPYIRMPSLAPKQQVMEPRLQSQLGSGVNRWPRMPGSSSLSRPQMPQLMMQQGIPGSMPLLHSNNFQMGNSQGFSSLDMLRFMKMENDDAFAGTSPSMSSFDFGPSHSFPPNQNPYGMERGIHQPAHFKQSTGNPLAMPQDPLSMSVVPNVQSQPQSMPRTPAPNSKQFNDNYNKFVNQVPNSPKLTHFGPSPSSDIFDQPQNQLSSQQKSPFSPFGDSLNDNLNSSQSVGMPNVRQNIPLSSSPMMQTKPLNLRSPTKLNPLMMQIQHLKQQIAQLEDNPMNSNFAQVSFLKQQLEQTYIQYISQQRPSDFLPVKERQANLQDFMLDKPPMTPRSQPEYSLDKPPPTPIPQQPINDFPLEKTVKNSRSIPSNEFMHERSLANAPPHLQQDFMMIKSPQTPAPQPQHDLMLDKPPMTPRPKPPQDFLLEKQQAMMHLQNDFVMDRPPHTPRPKLQQQKFLFEKPHQPLSQHQPSFLMESQPKNVVASRHDMLTERTLPSPRHQPDFLMEKLPTSVVSQLGQSHNSFNLVKSPLATKAPSQLGSVHEQTQQQHTTIPLQSPPNLFSQASQSPMSVTHSISQDPVDADMDIKDDMSFLDELFQTKLSEQEVKPDVEMMTLQSGRKGTGNIVSNSMPLLDGMHTSTPSSSIPPTMPILAPSVPPISATMPHFPPSLPGMSPGMHHMNQNPMSMQMPMMPMHYSNPMMMLNNMQEQGHPMGMPNMYNFGPMHVRPPSLKPPSLKEKGKSKSATRAASGLAPAAKKKRVRRKSSESDTFASSSPRTPMTPATPNSSGFSNVNNLNPSSNVSSVNSGDNIMAINPFTLDDNLADNAATRRSLRERKKKNYNDDYDYNLSDDEEKRKGENPDQIPLPAPGGHKLIAYKPSDAVEGEIAIIEKILAGRIRSSTKGEDGMPVDEEEYCVKYKGYSYLHCEWGTENELMKKDKRAQMKIKRFKAKRDPVAILSELDDEPFNPDFVEVDRVLDVNTCVDQVTGEPVTHYLVKWRSLPYEDSTWELKLNVDEPKIKQYLELKKPPPPEFQQYVARPQAFQWKKIEKSPVYKDDNTLRDYQLEGLNWLTFCWYKRQNCILADEMGLGKTVQGISLLCELKRFGVRGPFLVIAPLSTIVHWQREFEAWTDINAIVYHGSSPSRLLIQQYEMHYQDEKGEKISGIYKFEAVITTYEMILSDNDMLSKIPWRCVVIDEAHRLKNRNCKLLEGLNNLQLEHRVLLTGTPLQNNVEELFSLLNFLEPTRFPSQAAFLLEFGDLKTEAQVEKLQQILKPMMLRRLKEDVEKNVPPKEETIIEVELTTIQKKFYRAILEKNFTFLTRGLSTASNTPNLMNAMMELRKCCNHPFLINGAEERIVAEYANGAEGIEKITKHFKAMTESSGKMVLIDKLLPKLKAGGHKVLIFSQMVRVLDLLEDYLLCKKYLYERIDGRVRGTLRQAAIDRFCRSDSDRFVFLLCTRAGGLGINLTAADIVIIFDSDWNPQNDLQAQARCHRIGQSKSVKIYRLICRNTYEREMFDKASRKLALDRAVLQNMSAKESGMNKETGPPTPGNPPTPGTPAIPQPSMSKKEIEDLLKRGAYGSLMEEDGDASSKFCEEDIDQILERRTQVIQIVGEGKGSTFSKASFVSNTAKMDIDLDDPEFWTKWAQKASINVDELNQDNLIIDKPRERKQTKRFGNDDGAPELSDVESDDEDKPLPDVGRTSWSRAECIRVEKNLLIYGWGRWRDFLVHDSFKMDISERELEAISRTMLVFCLHHFKGDEKIKAFASNLISNSVSRARIVPQDAPKDPFCKPEPSDDKSELKKPVKQVKKSTLQSKPVLIEAGPDWKVIDPDTLIIDPSYRKHLQQHSKRILSRVRLLYCLRHEMIGNEADKIMIGRPASEIHLQVPRVGGDLLTPLWDVDADKSLLIGVFKHGYDKYDLIRKDPSLCFISKLGIVAPDTDKVSAVGLSPDNAAHERQDDDSESAIAKKKRKRRPNDDDEFLSDFDDFDNLPKFDKEDDIESFSLFESPVSSASPNMNSDPQSTRPHPSDLKWPPPTELNTRLRRLIAGYLKECEKEQMKLAQAEKEKERKERQAQQVREKQLKRAEMASRWSRREVTDFYRVVTTYGIIYDENTKKYDWSRFRKLAKLEKKDDDRITAYFEEFIAMCRRVCNKSTPEDIETKKGENLEPITDERANRVLHRVHLLMTIRNKVLPHENLDERLALCEPSSDFPFWWKPGTYDKELLIGVSRHGVGRTDFHLLADHDLKFKGILDELANELKTRRNMEKTKNVPDVQNAATEPQATTSQTPNSTAAVSQTTSAEDTPSSGINADRQPVATHNDKKPAAATEENEEQQSSVSKETAEILSSWPKDKALLNRLEKICHCVLNNAWSNGIDSNVAKRHATAISNQPLGLPGSLDRSELMRQPSANVGGQEGPRGERAEGLLGTEKNFKVTSLDGLKITVKKKRRRRTKEQMAAAAQLAQVPPPEHLNFPINHMPQMQGMPYNAMEKIKRGRRKRKGEMPEPNLMNNNIASSDEPPLKVVPHPIQLATSSEPYTPDMKMSMNPSIILHVPANMDQRANRVSNAVTEQAAPVTSPSQVAAVSCHHHREITGIVSSSIQDQTPHQSKSIGHSIASITGTPASMSPVHLPYSSHTSSHLKSHDPLTSDAQQKITHSHDVASETALDKAKVLENPESKFSAITTPKIVSSSPSVSSHAANKESTERLFTSRSHFKEESRNVCPNMNPFESPGLSKRFASDNEPNIFDVLPKQLYKSSRADFKASETASVPTGTQIVNSIHNTKPSSTNVVATSVIEKGSEPSLPGRYFEGHKASAAIAALAAKLNSQAASKASGSVVDHLSYTDKAGVFKDHKMPAASFSHSKHSTIMYTPDTTRNRNIFPGVPESEKIDNVASERGIQRDFKNGSHTTSFGSSNQQDVTSVNTHPSAVVIKPSSYSAAGKLSVDKDYASTRSSLHSLSALVSSQPVSLSSAPVKVVQSTPLQVSSKVGNKADEFADKNKQANIPVTTTALPVSTVSITTSIFPSSAESLVTAKPIVPPQVSKMLPISASVTSRSQSPAGKISKPGKNPKTSSTKAAVKRSSPVAMSTSVKSLNSSAAQKGNVTIAAGNHQFVVKLATTIASSVSKPLSSVETVASTHSIQTTEYKPSLKVSTELPSQHQETLKAQTTTFADTPRAAIRVYQARSNVIKSDSGAKTSSPAVAVSAFTTTATSANAASTIVSGTLHTNKKSSINIPTCVSVITPLSGLIRVVDAAKQQKGLISLSTKPRVKEPTKVGETVTSAARAASSSKVKGTSPSLVKNARTTVIQSRDLALKSSSPAATNVTGTPKAVVTTSKMSAAERISAKLQASAALATSKPVISKEVTADSVSSTTTSSIVYSASSTVTSTPTSRLKRDANVPTTSNKHVKSAKTTVITTPAHSTERSVPTLSSGSSVVQQKQVVGKSLAKQKSSVSTSGNRQSPRISSSSVSTNSVDGDHENQNNAPVASRTRPSTRRNTSLAGLSPGPIKKGSSKNAATVCSKNSSNLVAVKQTVTQASGQSVKDIHISIPFKDAPSDTTCVTETGNPHLNLSASNSKRTNAPQPNERKISTEKASSCVTASMKSNVRDNIKQDKALEDVDAVKKSVEQNKESDSFDKSVLPQFSESIVIQTTRAVTNTADRPKVQKKSLENIVSRLSKSKSSTQQSLLQSADGVDATNDDHEQNKDTNCNVAETSITAEKDFT